MVTLALDRVWYDPARPVLERVELTVAAGEMVVLTGPSGAGKSTLLSVIAGLHKNYDGAVEVGGAVALVPQKSCLLPWYTIAQNLTLTARARGLRVGADEAAKLLDELGLSDLANQYPGRVSGGQYRRAALGQALCSGASILLLDEPFSALDSDTKDACMALLLRLWRARGLTVLFVTHDRTEAAAAGGRIVRLGHE